MKRFALAAVAVVALTLPAAANPNCAKDYKGFWDSFNQTAPAKALSAEQYAIVSRQALRAFDACTAGDEAGGKNIFKRLAEAAPAKGDDFFKQLQQSAPAK